MLSSAISESKEGYACSMMLHLTSGMLRQEATTNASHVVGKSQPFKGAWVPVRPLGCKFALTRSEALLSCSMPMWANEPAVH
eukprot:1687034-Amphidinium_carterae.1